MISLMASSLNGAIVYQDTFDAVDGSYHFVALSQGNPGLTLNSVTLETIPEPSSIALIGLGGLGLLRRRR